MKTKFLTYFFGLMAMVLAACTSDEVEMTMQDAQTFVYAMDLDGGKLDFDATRAPKTWNSGDKIYIRFGKTNKGTATYNGSTWSLTTDQALEGSGSCTAVEIDGTVAENGSTVTMSGLNPVYQCNSGSFSLSGNVIKVSIKLTPATGRLRFKGTSGTSVNLEGMTTYSAYNTTTGEFTSTTAAVSTTIQSDGYTPYIYGTLTNTSEPTLKTNGYVMKCPTTMLQVGKSGWLTYPTDSKHTGWTKADSGSAPVNGSENGHEYVDLGVSVKWATYDVSNNSEGTLYRAWGEVRSDFNSCWWSTYKWAKGSEPQNNLTKYCTLSEYGNVDNKTQLDLEDDIAYVLWGGNWRLPTREEALELTDKNKFTYTWEVVDGKPGTRITSKINGNSIFLPANGYWGGTTSNVWFRSNSSGYFWTSSIDVNAPQKAYMISIDKDFPNPEVFSADRSEGLNVRPVCHKTSTR